MGKLDVMDRTVLQAFSGWRVRDAAVPAQWSDRDDLAARPLVTVLRTGMEHGASEGQVALVYQVKFRTTSQEHMNDLTERVVELVRRPLTIPTDIGNLTMRVCFDWLNSTEKSQAQALTVTVEVP